MKRNKNMNYMPAR